MTSFDTIIDRALVVIDDYKIAKIIVQSEEAFKTYMDGFVTKAIPKFSSCMQSLSYSNRQFSSDLTELEIDILSDLTVIEWWNRETNNGAQIALKLKTPSSFQTEGVSSQNLKEKRNVIDKLKEDVSRLIHDDYLLFYLDSFEY